MPTRKRNWLVWSIERNAWWKQASSGYTPRRDEAGRYTFNEARAIVRHANAFHLSRTPQEAMVEDIGGKDAV